MKRTTLWAVLGIAYICAFAGLRRNTSGEGRLDPMAPPARQVEQAIVERRWADARAVALDLAEAYPREPLVAYWLASIYRGLDRPADEASAWETFIRLSTTPADACPDIAKAYARMGDPGRSLRQYEQCVEYDPREPDRLVDLADALERAGRVDESLAMYRRAAVLDPRDPAIAGRIRQLSPGRAGA